MREVMDSSNDLQQLLNYAYFFLKFRPRSRKEMQTYLYKKIKKKHWSHDDADKVLSVLEEQGLLDDKSFIRWFVDQRVAHKQKSAFVLKQELMRHGVDKNLIDSYLSEYPIDEERLVFEALTRRWSRYKYLDKKERFQKASQFLLRRGFSFELIRKAIGRFESSV